MKLYRICTEGGRHEARAIEIVAGRVAGFTVLRGTGFWRGASEDSIVIEIADVHGDTVVEIAREIRAANNQQAVLIQTLTCEVELCTD